MLIHSASQVLTLAGGPQRGRELGCLGIIPDGAVLVTDEKIAAAGPSQELRSAYPHEPLLDAGGCVVMPGFIDPHTHAIWAGDRAAEFEMRLEGKTYLEILAAGGGILSTVHATRTASLERLLNETRRRLWSMFSYGTTTAEIKTGYGLRTAAELRMLQALINLNGEGPLELAFTFLGAHAIAPEFKDRPDDYTDLICETMLPMLKDWWPSHAPYLEAPFVDVFCETGAFSLEQSRRILQAAQSLGFPLKIHADEFDNLGGVGLAVELGAVSADHLVTTSAEEIHALAKSNTVAVALPATPFGLAEGSYTPARLILEAGRAARHRHRPQPRHGVVREHAICHCPGMPLPAPDAGASHRRCHHQRRGGNQPLRADRIDRAGQTGGPDHPQRSGLPPPWLPFRHEPGADGDQEG